MQPAARAGGWWPLAVALGVYAARVAWAVSGHWNEINPDAICYIRQARYLLEGRLADAVAGYWSPLVSWCLAPLMALGADSLHGLYVVVACWGGGLVLATALLLRRLTNLPPAWRLAVLLLVGDATLRWGATGFPDIILAACLMGAAVILAHPRFLHARWLPVACGALGGCGYLGKAYGLPYFVIFLPLGLIFLQSEGLRDAAGRRRLRAAWLTAMLVFVAVSLPWVVALSVKFHKPTFGLVGGINHAIIGPDDYSREELWQPVAGRITVWEIPETRQYRFWSPLESMAALRHQVAYSWATAKKVRDNLANFDYFGFSLSLVLLAPFILLAMGRRREMLSSSWVALVLVSYSLPFTLVYYDYRYVTPLLKPLCLVACCMFAWTLSRRLAEGGSRPGAQPGLRRMLGWAPAALILLSYVLHLNIPFRPYQVQEVDGTPYNNIVTDLRLHRGLAAELQRAGLSGPVAATDYWGGLYVAFAMDTPFVGSPAGDNFEACRDEMRDRGVALFLMAPQWRFADQLAQDPRWRRAMTLEVGEGQRIQVMVADSQTVSVPGT